MAATRGRQDQKPAGFRPVEVLLLLVVGVSVACFALWHVAVWATSDGLGLTDVAATYSALVNWQPLGGLGPGVHPASTPVVVVVFGALVAVAAAIWVFVLVLMDRWRRGRRPKGLASPGDVRRQVGLDRARSAAVFTRPQTFATAGGGVDRRAVESADVREFGYVMGTVQGSKERVVASHDDSVGVLGTSGSGKSRRLVIPACLDAIGPLVVTSTRGDVLDVIAEPAQRRGRLWVFDPLDSVGWPQKMVWDPVQGCEDGERAVGRGQNFVAGLGQADTSTTNASFFRDSASTAIQTLMHAAALDNRGFDSVIEWAVSLATADLPRQILQDDPAAEHLWHDLLLSVATGAEETVASTRTQLTNKLRPMMLRKVLLSVVPQPNAQVFDATTFVTSTDTLVLISDSNAIANVSPLTTMLLDEVFDAAKRVGRTAAGGRLDPPLRVVGDEIANVAPLPKLPAYASDSRALGIQVIWALQSLSQAEAQWTKLGARTLLANTSIKLVLGGLADLGALEELSRLLGEVEVMETNVSYSTDRPLQSTSSVSRREKRILRPEEIRQLPDGIGLALFRNAPGMLVALPSWDERPEAKQLAASERFTRARRSGGVDGNL